MERLSAIAKLKQAESSVLAVGLLVTGQWKLVRELHSKGVDTSEAEARLEALQKVQARCLLERERLLAVFESAEIRV